MRDTIHKIKFVSLVCYNAKVVLINLVVRIAMMENSYLAEHVNLVKVNAELVQENKNAYLVLKGNISIKEDIVKIV